MTGEVRVGVDVGGTFTDVTLIVDGTPTTAKVPTTEDDGSVGVLEGIRKACGEAGIEPAEIDAFDHATTVSVNALLERDGAHTALVTTAGFRDVLEIGRQERPALYDLSAEKPAPLVPRRRRYELAERATVDGTEEPIEAAAVRELAATIADDGVESVAVSFLHAYAHPDNERRAAAVLREELDVPVSISHEVLPTFREFERTATTVADAYVTPVIEGYLGRLTTRAREAGLPAPRVMQAGGGIADAETVRDRAVTTVLSGPAAGVVGAAATVEAATDDAAEPDAITFDMGGTSTDVSLVREGAVERTTEAEIDGVPIRTPMVDVTTVGAGGGSIARTDAGGALRVGPESAGADPGPACYPDGGDRPTVTDAAVVLGFIGPDAALGGELTLDVAAAREALADLAREAGLADAAAAARGVYRVANARMTRAIRTVTVERGHDPRGFTLVAFGGAGPMHAVALATELGVSRVIVPGPAGVLSSYGLLAADESHDAARTIATPLSTADAAEVDAVYTELVDRVLSDASDPDAARIERVADCRYEGQSFELAVPVPDPFDPDALADRFRERHERAYGYALEAPVEVVTLRATATIERSPPTLERVGEGRSRRGERDVRFPGVGEAAVESAIHDRAALAPGATVPGPAILEDDESTTVLPPGWEGAVRRDGAVVCVPGGEDR